MQLVVALSLVLSWWVALVQQMELVRWTRQPPGRVTATSGQPLLELWMLPMPLAQPGPAEGFLQPATQLHHWRPKAHEATAAVATNYSRFQLRW